MKNVLVTGRSGVGKTSVVEAVALEFPQVAGGFTTSEIRERGVRKGWEGCGAVGHFFRASS